MTDRELWVSVFNTALQVAGNIKSQGSGAKLWWGGEEVITTDWAKKCADYALKEAPGEPL